MDGGLEGLLRTLHLKHSFFEFLCICDWVMCICEAMKLWRHQRTLFLKVTKVIYLSNKTLLFLWSAKTVLEFQLSIVGCICNDLRWGCGNVNVAHIECTEIFLTKIIVFLQHLWSRFLQIDKRLCSRCPTSTYWRISQIEAIPAEDGRSSAGFYYHGNTYDRSAHLMGICH